MSFSEQVAAARFEATAKTPSVNPIDVGRMQELNAALAAISEELHAIPATLKVNKLSTSVEVKAGRHSLRIEVYFNTEIWNMYLLVCQDSSTEAFETFHKEATAEEVITRIAGQIGAFQGKSSSA